MNPPFVFQAKVCLSLVFALGVVPALMGAPPAKSKAPSTRAAVTNAPVAAVQIPASVFVIPATPKEGRNPFFPLSSVAPEVRPAKQQPRFDASVFVLNGITSPPRKTAMINGHTFEAGEEGEVKISNGRKLRVKCTEIRDKSAVILVGGQLLELRFRSGI